MEMNITKAKEALPNIKIGLAKYQFLLSRFLSVNVATDEEFQIKYVGFFRVRRNRAFLAYYFELMEKSKKCTDLTFEKILKDIYEKFGRVEASFSSKLLSMVNPNMPVWDVYVLANLNLKKPTQYSPTKLQEIIYLYDKICDWYKDFMKTEAAQIYIKLFDEKYPKAGITNTKKIDLILWQIR